VKLFTSRARFTETGSDDVIHVSSHWYPNACAILFAYGPFSLLVHPNLISVLIGALPSPVIAKVPSYVSTSGKIDIPGPIPLRKAKPKVHPGGIGVASGSIAP
jgi:hypothetical protein